MAMKTSDWVSVKLERKVKKELEGLKVHPRQAITEVVQMVLDGYKKYKTPSVKGKSEG